MERKTKIKFTDIECNLIINGMNEFFIYHQICFLMRW